MEVKNKYFFNFDLTPIGGWDDDKASSERYFICEKHKQGNNEF